MCVIYANLTAIVEQSSYNKGKLLTLKKISPWNKCLLSFFENRKKCLSQLFLSFPSLFLHAYFCPSMSCTFMNVIYRPYEFFVKIRSFYFAIFVDIFIAITKESRLVILRGYKRYRAKIYAYEFAVLNSIFFKGIGTSAPREINQH